MRRRSAILASLAGLMALLGGKATLAADGHPLVISLDGTLPLLLTVPHDGDEPIGSVTNRTNGPLLRDVGTRLLAERVATLLEKAHGTRPSLVIARFSRRFVDANRAERDGVESLQALPAYFAYHAEVARHVRRLRALFPKGALLLDIHAQSQEVDTVFRGTRGGLTVKALLQRHGMEAVQGDKSILGGLYAKGYNVSPTIGSPSLEEDRRFDGGYTVGTCGSHQPGGIDAIHLEFGKSQRERGNLPENVAQSVSDFLMHYKYVAR